MLTFNNCTSNISILGLQRSLFDNAITDVPRANIRGGRKIFFDIIPHLYIQISYYSLDNVHALEPLTTDYTITQKYPLAGTYIWSKR